MYRPAVDNGPHAQRVSKRNDGYRLSWADNQLRKSDEARACAGEGGNHAA